MEDNDPGEKLSEQFEHETADLGKQPTEAVEDVTRGCFGPLLILIFCSLITFALIGSIILSIIG